ncbi:MAG: hypothetical protein EZS28_048468 [Streblomastix strix]|uniref:C2 domain-containing protein n=1 Tax=Streblomastix strix TaxID=222440 RepID=A0A5J4TEU3_9EUKA|nr:MAG: hypothetical protein EZS28_048468 [Streblomastix strix]
MTYPFNGINKLEGQKVSDITLSVLYTRDDIGQDNQEQNQPKEIIEEIQQEQQQPIEEITKVDNDCPKGIVEVTVFGVKDVAAMDSNGKSDPYIKIIVGGITQKTKKKKDTLNAEFNETFKFDFDPNQTQERDIILELWDYDTFSDDDQIGKASFPV